jgi:hypothetical protein
MEAIRERHAGSAKRVALIHTKNSMMSALEALDVKADQTI